MGAVAGAALTAHRGRAAAAVGALAGAAGLGAAEAVARARQRPGEIPALWSRILASGALAAPLGYAADRLTGAGPVPVATAAGAAAGALGLRPQKVLLGPAVGALVGLGLRGRGTRFGGRRGGRRRLPRDLGRAVPRPAAEPARRAGEGRGRPVRGAAGQPDQVRRHGLRPVPGAGPWRHVLPRRGGHRHRGLAGRAGRAFLRPGRGGPAGPRVLRAHHPVRARHRAGVAAVGAARLPAVPDAAGPAAGPGQRADEPAGGAARGAQPDRHHHRRGRGAGRRRDGGGARLDPFPCRHRGAHLRGHLHHLPARGARLRQRRLPAAAGQLHRHAAAAVPAGRREWARNGPGMGPGMGRAWCWTATASSTSRATTLLI